MLAMLMQTVDFMPTYDSMCYGGLFACPMIAFIVFVVCVIIGSKGRGRNSRPKENRNTGVGVNYSPQNKR